MESQRRKKAPTPQESVGWRPKRVNKNEVKKALQSLLPNESFQTFMKYLLVECGYRDGLVGFNPHTAECTNTTIYNMARLGVYIELQRLMLEVSPQYVNKIELHEYQESKK